jgi:uncharacterized membrane protein YcaP (DUF421 family)
MKTIFKYVIFILVGALLADAGYSQQDWQFWAWLTTIVITIHVRDWAHNA